MIYPYGRRLAWHARGPGLDSPACKSYSPSVPLIKLRLLQVTSFYKMVLFYLHLQAGKVWFLTGKVVVCKCLKASFKKGLRKAKVVGCFPSKFQVQSSNRSQERFYMLYCPFRQQPVSPQQQQQVQAPQPAQYSMFTSIQRKGGIQPSYYISYNQSLSGYLMLLSLKCACVQVMSLITSLHSSMASGTSRYSVIMVL